MKTIEERALIFADRHEEAELNLRGLGSTYGYDRIKNAEICAYERGAKDQRRIDIDMACKCFCKTCMGQCKDTSHCDTLQKFRNELNAMEE